MNRKNIILTFVLLAVSVFASAQSITHTYHFNQPIVQQIGDYQTLAFENSVSNGTIGEPTLPWKSISLMLPQNTEATAIHVVLSDFTELEGQYNLMPAQRPRPISDDSPFVFEKNEDLYRSNEAYPNKEFNTVSTQVLNGVSFAFGGFTPVKFKPASGQVSYAQTVTVTVEYQTSRIDNSKKLWLRPETQNSISRLAQNAEMLDTYARRDANLPSYEVLIVTTENFAENFNDYIALYAGHGLRVHVATIQDIYAAMQGRDNQEKIRNYIIQEYENNGISMVMIGGDVDVVPHRNLWCWAQEGYEDQVPSDTYFACLDGTLNDDNDNKWGEVGEDDILPELAISRLPFHNAAELETILSKTFSYLTSPVLGEFRKPSWQENTSAMATLPAATWSASSGRLISTAIPHTVIPRITISSACMKLGYTTGIPKNWHKPSTREHNMSTTSDTPTRNMWRVGTTGTSRRACSPKPMAPTITTSFSRAKAASVATFPKIVFWNEWY